MRWRKRTHILLGRLLVQSRILVLLLLGHVIHLLEELRVSDLLVIHRLALSALAPTRAGRDSGDGTRGSGPAWK
jgi:hypothetical protein